MRGSGKFEKIVTPLGRKKGFFYQCLLLLFFLIKRKYDSWPGHGKEGVGEYKFPSNFYKLKFPDVPKTHASLKILDLAMK